MNTRKCNYCGWESPITNTRTCFVCHKAFNEGLCKACGQHSNELDLTQFKCPACMLLHRRNFYFITDIIRDTAIKIFEDWREQFKEVPTPYKTLTEQEWQKACRYFKGCALCKADSIDARSYFIPFEKGGPYTSWNVIPVCDKCAAAWVQQSNPWLRMHKQLNTTVVKSRNFSYDNLNQIVAYLQERLEEVKCKK